MNTREHCTDSASWTFTDRDGVESRGILVLNSRNLICYDDEIEIAWTRSFRTRAEARASFEGDLRAMRKNDCYTFH